MRFQKSGYYVSSSILAAKQAGRLCSTLGDSSMLGEVSSLLSSLHFLICLVGVLGPFQRGSPVVTIKSSARFSAILPEETSSLPSFDPGAGLFGLPLGAFLPATAVVRPSIPFPSGRLSAAMSRRGWLPCVCCEDYAGGCLGTHTQNGILWWDPGAHCPFWTFLSTPQSSLFGE